MDISVPVYMLKQLCARCKRIADNATCSPSDTRTANSLRLIKKDISKLEKYIDRNENVTQVYNTTSSKSEQDN